MSRAVQKASGGSSRNVRSPAQAGTGAREMSSGTVSAGALAARGRGRLVRFTPPKPDRVDAEAILAQFGCRWPELIAREFFNDREAAAFFDTDQRTIRFWRDGETQPRARHVLRLALLRPAAFHRLIEAA